MHHLREHHDSGYQHVKGRQFKPVIFPFFLIACLGSMSYGYSASVISTTLVQPTFVSYMELGTKSNANTLIGLTGSMYFVGGFIGTFNVAFFADRYGRRWGIATPVIATIIFATLLTGSVNINMFIAFRFFAGWCGYMLMSAPPIWMSEVAPPNVRGLLTGLHGAGFMFGYFLAPLFGYAFFLWEYHNSWRVQQAINIIPCLFCLAGLPFIPESPRWLVTMGRHEEARATLKRIHTASEAEVEYNQILQQASVDVEVDTSYRTFLFSERYRYRAFLCFLFPFGVQLAGPISKFVTHVGFPFRGANTHPVITNYGPIFYNLLGYDTAQQILFQMGWLGTGTIGASIAPFIIDRFPRPKLATAGLWATISFLIIEAALIASFATSAESLENPNHVALGAAVAVFFLYVLVWTSSVDTLQLVFTAELCPTQFRAKAVSLGMAGLSVMNINWLQAAPIAIVNIGWKFFLALIIPAFLFGFAILWLYPDTNGVPLEEIAAIFGDEEAHNPEEIANSVVVDAKEPVERHVETV